MAMALAVAAPAAAVPPPNDVPGGSAAALFLPYTAENGIPALLQATAELAEATPDAGVPRCLGPRSFARTVWYRVPEQPTATEMTLEATGQTLDVVDLAAFVQDEVPAARARAAQVQSRTSEPNACDGAGAGGSDATDEPTAAVTLRVPARHAVLFQVGRRGAVQSPDVERAYLALEVLPLPTQAPPTGDAAGTKTPTLRGARTERVTLAGATITAEDPAEPPCPSLGTVWRRFVPTTSGRRVITVTGQDATTLTAFAGTRPGGDDVLDCVNREGHGALRLNVPVKRGRPVWVRVGADGTDGGERARLRVTDGARATVIDGGPGGFDPTPYGPGGGFPSACDTADATAARVSGARLRGRAGAYNRFRRVPARIRVRGASVCDAQVRLLGPGGHTYARASLVRVKPGRSTLRLPRLRTFRRGRYRLELRGVTLRGKRVVVAGTVTGVLGR
jgi:hypothetical protein